MRWWLIPLAVPVLIILAVCWVAGWLRGIGCELWREMREVASDGYRVARGEHED